MSSDNASKFLNDLLALMVRNSASDLFLTADYPPAMKVDGKLVPVAQQPLTPQHTVELARALMNERQAAQFEATKEANFSVSPGSIGRFRVNAYMQLGRVGVVVRVIHSEVPDFKTLALPDTLKTLALEKRGLVFVVGGTGSGKSTTLAAMVDHRNKNSHGHIVTVEDPIEYVHRHQNCIISQREIGIDTESWEVALKNALRQAPDVVLIGEVRDRKTIEHAIAYAETGHLCLATLHASNANQALDRIINFFPEDRRNQLLMDLAFNLKAVVSQRLVPKLNSKGRIAAVEIMLNTPYIADLIFKASLGEIKDAMKRATEQGMQTFDQALFKLFDDDLISYEDALRNADSLNDLRLKIKLEGKRRLTDASELAKNIEKVGLVT